MSTTRPHEHPAPLLRLWQPVAFFFFAYGLYVLQCQSYYLDPVLFGKDAGLTFPYFYGGEKGFGSIYLKTQGYFSFTLYFFPWLFAHFSTAWQPYLYTWSASAFILLPTAFVLWSSLFQAWTARWLFALLIAFWHYYANGYDEPGTIFVLQNMSFWPVCLLYFLIVLQMIADAQRPRRVIVLTLLAVPALISHPFTIVAVPALAFLLCSRVPRATRICAGVLMLLSLVYATTHQQEKANYLALFMPQTILDYIQYLVNGIFCFHLVRLSHGAAITLLVSVAAAASIWYWWRPQDFRHMNRHDGFILFFIAGLSAIYFASYRYEHHGTSVPLRYSYVQQNLWLIFLLRRVEHWTLPTHGLRVRTACWTALTVVVLLLRGAGTESSFVHLHDHEAAVEKELYSAMGVLEDAVAENPQMAFLIFTPNHNWPTRNYLIGEQNAVKVIDFCHISREPLVGWLQAMDLTGREQETVLAAHEIFGVEKNLVKNGDFTEWDGDVPVGWTIKGSGPYRLSPATVGEPEIPVMVISMEAPDTEVILSQTVVPTPYAPGSILRFKLHTLQSDANPVRVRFFVRADGEWTLIEERPGTSYHYWIRQAWDCRLPDVLENSEIRVEVTFRPKEGPVQANVTNGLIAVLAP